MSLYRDPKENRDYYRVEVTPGKSAYLVLDAAGGRVEVSNVSAGGFAISSENRDLAGLPLTGEAMGGYLHKGSLFLAMEDHDQEVRVPMVFRVIDTSGLIHCEIVNVDEPGKDHLYTFVWEADQRQRRGGD